MTKIAAVHPTVAVVTDVLVAIIETLINQKHITISARKKTADHRNIRIKSGQEQKKPTKTSSITIQKKRFNNRFEKRFKQYITKCEERNNEDLEAEANDIFESLILDIKSKLNLKKPTNRKELESGITYFTAFGELIFNKATSMSTILANKAFSYLLILEDMTKPTPVIDPFIYILNISSS
jgi:hypothetical protein